MIIAPSVLSFHYDDFKNQIKELNESVEWIHYDVMDGNFVPNITFGPDILKYFRKNSSLFLDVHLMVNDPDFFVDTFAKAGADSIVFHYESYNDIELCKQTLDKIHSKYINAGISIKPDTSVETIFPVLDKCEIVLVMSVEPGFGGQKFNESAYEKIKELAEYREMHDLSYVIEVDGGINDTNAHELIEVGADALVAGSFIFSGDIKQNAEILRNCDRRL